MRRAVGRSIQGQTGAGWRRRRRLAHTACSAAATAVRRPQGFLSYLEPHKPAGNSLPRAIVRDGQQNVALTLGQRPATQAQAQPGSMQPGQ
jgi:hypothetical protein